jgi:hypothetical protein
MANWSSRWRATVEARPAWAEPAVARVPDAVGGPPAVIIADRFGHIYHVEAGGQAHAFSEPRELEEWLRFIGTQCPE